MNEIQEVIFNIAKEIKRICDKHSLRYFLDYGSLLGAVRHNGFIPWDDDIDFCMPRPDYEKFIEVCNTDLNDRFALRSMRENGYIYYYIKIDDKTTTLIEDFNKKSGCVGGVYVDVFPLDGLPSDKTKRKHFIRKCRYLYLRANLALVDFSSKKYPFYKRMIINLFKHSNGKKYLRKLDCLLKKYGYDNATTVSSDILQNAPVPKRLFEESSNYTFENCEFTSVKDSDEYLRLLYGDYMQLPPIDKRVSNHFHSVDLHTPYINISEKENHNA